MTDLEAREKKRAPPPKLQPIKVEQLRDKEAYLADYFGEASLPFVPQSTALRPPKRPVYSKARTTQASITPNTTTTTNTTTANTPTTANTTTLKAEAGTNHPTASELFQPSASAPAAPRISLAVDESYTSALFTGGESGHISATTEADAPMLHRLRSSSRLAEQEMLQRQQLSSGTDAGPLTTPELSETPSEPKPTFVVPQVKLVRNPAGKENYLPLTPISSRSKTLKPITKSGPRKSFNWGRPHRGEVVEPEEQETSKTTGSNIGSSSVTDMQTDLEKRETVAGVAARSVRSVSPDISIRHLRMNDTPIGQTRGRQGSHRDYNESASTAKKMRLDFEAPSEQIEFSPKRVAGHSEVDSPSFHTISVASRLASVMVPSPSTTPSLSPDHSKEPVVTKTTPPPPPPTRKTFSAAGTTDNEPTEKISVPSRSPELFRHSQPNTPSPPAYPTQHKRQPQTHIEGIASIAQHLAVGSAKAPPMPRPTFSPPEFNPRPGAVSDAKQTAVAPPTASDVPAATATAGVTAPSSMTPANAPGRAEFGPRQVMMVNNRPYTRLAQVGKGGSSKVYKVLASNSRIFALKKVSFEKADQLTITGYVNEVKLLTRLSNNSRIIRLFDAEINYSKGSLSLVMEYGEIDLAHMLLNQREQPFDIHFIGLYWRQMLEAVQLIHEEKIVHSDLKPANFLLVEGSLKLIDFGIANAIANDTTNIHREGQLGTANYMSPEAIMANPAAGGCRKLGRASDVWSLGCILYQMVYGKTPFSDVTNVFQKLGVIMNPGHRIAFPVSILSPLQPKRSPTSLTTAVGVEKGADLAAGPTSENSKAGSGGGGGSSALMAPAGSGSSPGELVAGTRSDPALPQIIRLVAVDPHLIRIMKGCLAYDSKDRMTIPGLLIDPFLHPAPLVSSHVVKIADV